MKKLIKYFALLLLLNGATGANAQIYDPSKITPEQKKRDECIRLSNHNPQKAIDMAIDWRSHFGANDAEYCLGIANINNDNFEYGARKLMEIAPFFKARDIKFASLIYTQAANGYLLAKLPEQALNAINIALEINKDDANSLIDRARIYADLEKWPEAEQDLTKAMKLKEPLGFALRLRAETLLRQNKFDDAIFDIDEAIKLEPKEVENYVMRGRIREAKRLFHKNVQ